jgi:hypothetical protein
MKAIILILFSTLLTSSNLMAQTFVKKGESISTSNIVIKYFENKGGNRPSLSISYKDGFSMFSHVMPVCGGDYEWCLRNDEFEDIAYLKIDFYSNKLIAKIKIDNYLFKQKNYEKIKKHINLIAGEYLIVKKIQ